MPKSPKNKSFIKSRYFWSIVILIFLTVFSTYLGRKYLPNLSKTQLPSLNDLPLTLESADGILESLPISNSEEHPLSIASLQKTPLQIRPFQIDNVNFASGQFTSYLGHYYSQGLKINTLINLPQNIPSEIKLPVIIFIHGYIPPQEYQTTAKYVAYTNYLSNNGYAVFKIDLRGHGDSEGEPSGAYGSNDYTIDVLHAIESIVQNPDITDPNGNKYTLDGNNIGIWGHSMGGYLGLRTLVVNKRAKVGVFWAGVVASHSQLINNWRRSQPFPTATNPARRWRNLLIEKYGSPEVNVQFWDSLSSTAYLQNIDSGIQLHHSRTDDVVPFEFSEKLHEALIQSGKTSELYIYENDDHNLAKNFSLAMRRSVEFFDRYLKEKK